MVHIRWFPTGCALCSISRLLSFILFRWCPGILNTDWDGKPQITTRNTAVFRPLSLYMSARLYFHNICQDFSQVCFTSSYPIELVTEISCLLFDISDFCLHHSFTTAHFLNVCFLHCRRRLVTRPSLPRIVEPLFSLYLLVLEIIFGLFLCLPHIPYLSWLLYLYHLSSHL